MSPDASRSTVPAKATLFCPECGRQGNARTDWPERLDCSTGNWLRYCPACGTALSPCSPADIERSPARIAADGGAGAPADD